MKLSMISLREDETESMLMMLMQVAELLPRMGNDEEVSEAELGLLGNE